MAIEVELPDGSVVEFPDGTDNATMERALSQYSAAPEPEIVGSPGVQSERSNPTEGMGQYEKYRAGLGRSMATAYTGGKQALTDAARFFVEEGIGQRPSKNVGSLVGGGYSNNNMAGRLRNSLAEQTKAIDEERRLSESLMQTPAGAWGNIVGTGAQYLLPGVAARGTMLGRAIMPTTVKGNAALGSVSGLLQGVGNDETRAGNAGVGLLAGGFGAALPVGAHKIIKGLLAPFKPFTTAGNDQAVASILRGSASNPASLSRVAPSAIPGVQRSLAEEVLDPGIASLQRGVQARSGQGAAYDTVRRQNNAARATAIGKFAGDEATIQAAVTARAQAANPLRRDAMKLGGVDTSRLLGQVKRLEKAQEGRPAIKKALQDVRGLLTRDVPEAELKKAALKPLADYVAADKSSAVNRDVAKAAMTAIRNGEVPSGRFMAPSGTRTKSSAESGKAALAESKKALLKDRVGHDQVAVLYNARKTIGDMLSGKYGGDSAQALAGSRELMAVKNQLDRVLSKQAPEFGQYLEAYKAGSKPINRMELGQTLLDSGTGKTRDAVTGAYTIMPGAFGGQVKNLDSVAAKATGFKKAKAANILEPQDFSTIRAVEDDLSRQVFADTAARQGSDTYQKLMNEGNVLAAMREIGISVPGGGVLKMLGDKGVDRVNRTLVDVMANPAQARRILATVPATDRRIIQQILARTGGGAGIVTSSVAE